MREGRKLPFWLQSRWVWRGMAMAFALLLAISAGAGVFWGKQNAAVAASEETRNQVSTATSDASKDSVVEKKGVFSAAQPKSIDIEAASAVLVKPQAEVVIQEEKQIEEASKPAKAEAVSPEEMQKALRAAGKALRGASQ